MKYSYLVYIIRDKVENLYEKQYSENVHCSEGTKSLLHRHNYICTFTIHYFVLFSSFNNVPMFYMFCVLALIWDFPVAQTVKNLPVMQETRVRSLGWEVPLEKGMAIHSSILAWRIPWTEKPSRL